MSNSKWRFGCGKEFIRHIPRGYGYKAIKVECGSTAYDGNVNQCDVCAEKYPVSPVRDDESDLEWFDRQDCE